MPDRPRRFANNAPANRLRSAGASLDWFTQVVFVDNRCHGSVHSTEKQDFLRLFREIAGIDRNVLDMPKENYAVFFFFANHLRFSPDMPRFQGSLRRVVG